VSKIYAGIDAGSTQCKVVLFGAGEVIDVLCVNMGWDVKRTAGESLDVLLSRHGLAQGDVVITATGYGREAVDSAGMRPTEITCHARGALFLRPDIQGVVDIGGQDSKVIRIENGRVADFIMNDKCAAGTGRFLSMAAETLGIPFSGIDDMTDSASAVSITSMCTVFAESELIGLLAKGTDRRQLMGGVLESIAKKLRQQAGKLELAPNRPLLMTGGLSACATLRAMLSKTMELPVIDHPYALYAGAVGAAVYALENS
jgi:predicted CoA-substrate-specific enzyme activase